MATVSHSRCEYRVKSPRWAAPADGWLIETPVLIRFGQLTSDEYFVSHQAAQEGVVITNPSTTDPLVMLKHFGPDSGAPQAGSERISGQDKRTRLPPVSKRAGGIRSPGKRVSPGRCGVAG